MKICPQCQTTYSDDLRVCPDDRTPLAVCDVWPEQTVVDGKYRILAKVGHDIGCSVYKALQLRPEKLRALKVLNWNLVHDAHIVSLFEQDALLRKKIRHDNVARLEALEHTKDGRPFIIMEYVEGRRLQAVIANEGPLAPLRACGIVQQVAEALEAAHALGLVHRDVNPASIFLTNGFGGDNVKLLGFGIAQLKEALLGDQFRTSPEAVIGTLQYVSPEQALGHFGDEIDGRADLYSLGVILYQMLTGNLPFRATTPADWMMAHIQGNPLPIAHTYPHLAIPDGVIQLVMHCLKKSREQRPASARELVRELQDVEKEIERSAKAQGMGLQHRKASAWKFWKS